MEDYQAIFDWVKGTGLRPILSMLNEDNQAQFAKAYIHAIQYEYPLQANNKILLPFRRLFMVGYKWFFIIAVFLLVRPFIFWMSERNIFGCHSERSEGSGENVLKIK